MNHHEPLGRTGGLVDTKLLRAFRAARTHSTAAIASVMPAEQAAKGPPPWLPSEVDTANYDALASYGAGIGNYIQNSIIVASITILGTLVVGTLGGYGFSRFAFPGKGILFLVILATLMVPFQSILIPLFMWLKQLGLLNTEIRFPILENPRIGPVIFPPLHASVFFDTAFGYFSSCPDNPLDPNFAFCERRSSFQPFRSDPDAPLGFRLNDLRGAYGFGLATNLFGFAVVRASAAWLTDLAGTGPTQFQIVLAPEF